MVIERSVKGGALIAIEGIHGSGKSTQVEALRDKLRDDGFNVVVTKEVAGTPLADQIYDIAFQNSREPFDNPLIMTLLIAASRASRVNQIIKPTLEVGGIVIADRYEGSMLVYQHYCDGVEEKLVRELNRQITQGIRADITFIVDVEPKEGYRRRMQRLGQGEQIKGWDARSEAFHIKSREAYHKFTETEPGWLIVNGMSPPEQIAEEIYKKTAALIENKNATGNS